MKYYLVLAIIVASGILTSSQHANGLDFEIKALYGQPDYKSVNLTWETEEKTLDNEVKLTNPPKRSFVVHYCELQSWGDLHRCKSKVIEENQQEESFENTKLYKLTVKNLRMATKYSFHVKPQVKSENDMPQKEARSDDLSADNSIEVGASIIIPTKGFSAEATKCLPEASEIVVETGPYFGGKIASENGDCEIDGDPNDPREVYTMRIDHKACGSVVSHDDLTVETYITVQENSGILTHSTRRFLVVCTFQPDTLTVRARLALPGKGGATAMDTDDLWQEKRSGRERQFKMVDKSALILKESDEKSEENAIPDIENLTEKIMSLASKPDIPLPSTSVREPQNKLIDYYTNARYSPLSSDNYSNESSSFWSLHTHSIIGISIGIALSLVVVFIFVFLLQHESRKQRQSVEKLTNVYS